MRCGKMSRSGKSGKTKYLFLLPMVLGTLFLVVSTIFFGAAIAVTTMATPVKEYLEVPVFIPEVQIITKIIPHIITATAGPTPTITLTPTPGPTQTPYIEFVPMFLETATPTVTKRPVTRIKVYPDIICSGSK